MIVARRHRLAVRVYLVTAAALVAVLVAIYVLAATLLAPPRHGGPFSEMARYAAAKVSERWASEGGVKDEVTLIRAQMDVAVSAYRWDGTLVAAVGAPAPPLSADERQALATRRPLERGGVCTRERCQLAFAVPSPAGPRGYLILENADRHPGPPPFGVLMGALLALALGAAAALVGRDLARPLERLASTAQAIGRGELTARTGLARRDELGAVARAFDDMAERVEKLVRTQTELLANVAHELRTPLARIRVALDLAEDGDPAVARESLAEIMQDLAELEGLVNDILTSARLELSGGAAGRGAPPLKLAALDIARVVNGATERLRHRHPGRQVEVELEPGLPLVDADAVLLRRALDNLLDNAQKYSRPGSVIRARAARGAAGVTIAVIDAGEGIPPEDLPRLFTPFFRGDKSRTRATGGVGLGLSLARRIVEAHGGTLTAESTPAVGTTMTIALPPVAPPP